MRLEATMNLRLSLLGLGLVGWGCGSAQTPAACASDSICNELCQTVQDPDCIGTDGAAPDGPTPDGPTPDGPTPDGPTPDGPTPDGMLPDGSLAMNDGSVVTFPDGGIIIV